MRGMRIVPALTVLALLAAACGGSGSASTTTTTLAPTTTAAPSTTAAPTTTTTTTTTLPPTTTTTTLPPPQVAWGDPQTVLTLQPDFFVQRGQVIDAQVRVIASWGDAAYLFVGADLSGRVHDLGGVTQTDHYSDVRVWSSPDGADWTEGAGLPFPGSFDEWAYGAVPFGDELAVVGAWRESGTNPAQVQGFWTFPTDDPDGAAWVGSGFPPTWVQADPANLGGDRKEEMLDVVVLDGLLVAVGKSDFVPELGEPGRAEYGAAVWTSADGRAWDRVPDDAGVFSGPGNSTRMKAAVGDAGTVWAFGIDDSARRDDLAVWSTPDGTTWERLELDGERATGARDLVVADAARSPLGFVVVGNEFGNDGRFPAIWFSPDGIQWERPDPGVAFEGELVSVAATDFGFIAVGFFRPEGRTSPLVLLSGDGRNWYQEAEGAFEVEGTRRSRLTAVGVHAGTVLVGGLVTYFDDYRDVVVWSGPVGPGSG
ncbi:MAG: hypothetical protein FJW79_07480 [Actinobacteria bacterium]|nr:hypothetical protein [Actinomycetota bacterium]